LSGRKLAVYEVTDTDDYRRRSRDHYVSSFPMVPIEPACAGQLVEQAVQYAQGLGFAPHSVSSGSAGVWRLAGRRV
jgi:hypothetical protein